MTLPPKDTLLIKKCIAMPFSYAIGADHRGYKLKEELVHHAPPAITLIDVGTDSDTRTDYPIYAEKALALCEKQPTEILGAILLCGTGAGMAIAANRHAKIYAGVAWTPEIARRLKEEDNCSVLVLPADYIDYHTAYECILAWHTAQFKEGRYKNRIALLN